MSQTTTVPSSLIADLRALPRAFWILFAGMFINRFGTFVWPFLTIYLTRQGHSLTEAGSAVAIYSIGSLCGGVTGGWLADHIGRKPTIVLGTFGAATALILLYSAPSLPFVLVAAWLTGMMIGIYHPAISALFADIVPPELRVRGWSAYRLAANAGFACGVATGGVLANYSFFWLFVGDALTTLTFGIVAFWFLPAGRPRTKEEKAPWNDALRQMSRDRAFHWLWTAAFLSALIYAQFGATYSLHITRMNLSFELLGHNFGPEMVFGLLMGWNGLLVVLAELPLTSYTMRFETKKVMAIGYILVGMGFAGNALARNIGELWLMMSIFTVGEMISAPLTSAYVAKLAPERMRGRYMGMLGLAWNSAGIVGPLIGFRLLAIDARLIWLACGVFGLGAAFSITRRGWNAPLPTDEQSGFDLARTEPADRPVVS